MASVFRAFNWLVDVVLVTALAVITVVLVTQVFSRYVLHSALAWPEELAQFLLVLISFTGMYRAVGKDQHIRIDYLPKDSAALWLRLFRLSGLLLVCAFLAYVGYGGWILAMSAWDQPSTALRLPMGIPYLMIPVSCFLTVLAILAAARGAWTRRVPDSETLP